MSDTKVIIQKTVSLRERKTIETFFVDEEDKKKLRENMTIFIAETKYKITSVSEALILTNPREAVAELSTVISVLVEQIA